MFHANNFRCCILTNFITLISGHKNVNENAESKSSNQGNDPGLDMYMFLDPQLRPVTPDMNDEQSRQIFEEHKQLAEEYLKVSLTSYFKILTAML